MSWDYNVSGWLSDIQKKQLWYFPTNVHILSVRNVNNADLSLIDVGRFTEFQVRLNQEVNGNNMIGSTQGFSPKKKQ